MGCRVGWWGGRAALLPVWEQGPVWEARGGDSGHICTLYLYPPAPPQSMTDTLPSSLSRHPPCNSTHV